MTIPVSIFAAGGGSLVDLDTTVLIQLGIFLILFILLRFLFFKPIIRLIEARHQATETQRAEAARLESEAAELNQEIAGRLAGIRASVSKERLGLEEQAQKQHRALAVKTREECLALAQETRKELEIQAEQVRAQLQQEIQGVALSVAHKVLGRPV